MQYLVAVDGSESSTEALEYAIDLATRADASLLVAYAVEPRVLVEENDEEAPTNAEVGQRIYTEDLEVAEERGEEVLDDARERAERAGVPVETTLLPLRTAEGRRICARPPQEAAPEAGTASRAALSFAR